MNADRVQITSGILSSPISSTSLSIHLPAPSLLRTISTELYAFLQNFIQGFIQGDISTPVTKPAPPRSPSLIFLSGAGNTGAGFFFFLDFKDLKFVNFRRACRLRQTHISTVHISLITCQYTSIRTSNTYQDGTTTWCAPLPEMACSSLTQLVFCKKVVYWC